MIAKPQKDSFSFLNSLNLPNGRITILIHNNTDANEEEVIPIKPWTDKEEKRLVDFILKNGSAEFSWIRKFFPGRTFDELRKRSSEIIKSLKNYVCSSPRFRKVVFDVKKNLDDEKNAHQETLYNTIFGKKCVISHGKYVFDNRKRKVHYNRKSQNQHVRHPPKTNFLGKYLFI
jgi:hypothetical protein